MIFHGDSSSRTDPEDPKYSPIGGRERTLTRKKTKNFESFLSREDLFLINIWNRHIGMNILGDDRGTVQKDRSVQYDQRQSGADMLRKLSSRKEMRTPRHFFLLKKGVRKSVKDDQKLLTLVSI